MKGWESTAHTLNERLVREQNGRLTTTTTEKRKWETRLNERQIEFDVCVF